MMTEQSNVGLPLGPPILSAQELTVAIEAIFTRMDSIERDCAGRFPLFRRAADAHWQMSSGGSWKGGFWVGMYWLRAYVQQSRSDREKAANLCRTLAAKLDEPSQNRSLIYWYGAALGDRWFADADARQLAQQASSHLAETWRSNLACLPVGCAMGGGREGDLRISIDPLASTVQLLWRYGDQLTHDRLDRHLQTVTRVLGDGSGAYAGHAHLQPETCASREVAGNWSRGQAWAMLGLVRAAAQYGEPYIRLAEQSVCYWLNSRPEPWVLNRLNQRDKKTDPSAMVIAAIAMQILAKLSKARPEWNDKASKLLTAAVRSGKENPGVFAGLCYSTGGGVEELVESPCSSFFLLAGLLVMAGKLAPEDF
jgi:unsaturated chondroitin disaccharide hydrolase